MTTDKIAIMWFRRDLRLEDNTAFIDALKHADVIIPIFIFTRGQVTNKNPYKSDKSIQFMVQSLKDLDNQLFSLFGAKLFTFYGENNEVLQSLINKNNVTDLYLNTDYTPFSKHRDYEIEKICSKYGVSFNPSHDICLLTPGSIKTGSGDTYQKFTPFYNKYLDIKIPQPQKISKKYTFSFKKRISYNIDFEFKYDSQYGRFIEYNENSLLIGGRNRALERLKQLKHFKNYENTRNDLTKNTTFLSAYLKYGCISVREVYAILLRQFGKTHPLIRQLVWRDFYIHLLDAFPRVLNGESLKQKYDTIKWENNNSLFNAWKKGVTGYPIVDANMRMLNNVGFMHNRGRLIVASFLVKTLLIDWRWGEKYFAQQLIDYDPAANNGNWQWVSGSGADSQPYFRIFNPWSQSAKHDIDAEFIKKWIPELSSVDAKHIHQWNTWCKDNRYSNIKYPEPIVDYGLMRTKALALYKKYV